MKNASMKNIEIGEVMTEQVLSLSPNDDVMAAKKLMNDHHIHHVPILLDGKLEGIVSVNDIEKIEYLCDFIGEKLADSTVFKALSLHEIMTKNVISIGSKDKISEAILIFSNANFHSLPVIDEGLLVGIVSSKDIFRNMTLE